MENNEKEDSLMKFNLLINQLDEHNEVGILLAQKYKIKSVVMLYRNKEKKKLDKFKELYLDLNRIEVIDELIEEDNYDNLKNIISKYKEEEIIINLTGGNRITSLIMLKIAIELNLQCVYVDLLKKRRYIFDKEYRIIEQPLEDRSISDAIHLSGANITLDSTSLAEKSDIQEFTKAILSNLDIWHKYKQKLYDNNIFKHDYKDTSRININKCLVENEEFKLIYSILNYLKEKNEIEFMEDKDNIEVVFKNDYLKGFIFKSGTWLEVLTTLVVQSIEDIDEVKSGLTFYWGDDLKRVRNELDVVAIRDSVLICISCKDSDKYDEDALNELQVYSERLGGRNAIKILVATKQPVKKTVLDRAKEMNINIVILDKNIDIFKKVLIDLIKKKTV
ncbi:Card1-like endonuclease domain-containing protein [Clostridium paraputrificum]|uniref:Card1-like endonuclease domain-containing protein n=1 Tax=Clostridium paraputrificum TaxID=29363 RepID=UPI00325A616A